MDKNISIEQYFNQPENSEITAKKASPFISLAILAVGIVFVALNSIIGAGASEFIHPLLITLSIIFILWGVLAFAFRKKHFIYTADNQNVKVKDLYFSIKERDKLVKMVTSATTDDLDMLEKSTQDALKIRVAYTENCSFCMAQVVVYIPYEYVNATPVLKLPDNLAKQLVAKLK